VLSRWGFEFAGALAAFLAFEKLGANIIFMAELDFGTTSGTNIIFYET